MKKYAKIINEETKQCEVGMGTNAQFYESLGMSKMDVGQAYNGAWYVEGYLPEPTKKEQSEKRATAYQQEVDPITAHIQRLRDEEEPDEEEIADLIEERNQKVEEIKERYPYPEEVQDEEQPES